MSKKRAKAMVVHYGERTSVYDVTGGGIPIPMDESYLRKHNPSIVHYKEADKLKIRDSVLNNMKVREVTIPTRSPDESIPRIPPKESLDHGVQGLLSLADIWEKPFVGFWILSCILIAMRCSSLRKSATSDLFFATEIKGASQELIDYVEKLIFMVNTNNEWDLELKDDNKEKKTISVRIHRDSVLRYVHFSGFTPTVQDFTEMTITPENWKPVRLPAIYEDSISAVIGASSKQLNDILPLMSNSYVLLRACLVSCGPA